MQHHCVFRNFRRYNGMGKKGYAVNFLGVFTDFSHICSVSPDNLDREDMETNDWVCVSTQYSEFKENYFEWISVLESVVQARHNYTAIELGAGYGPHLINAAVAIKNYHGNNFPIKLIGVEGEPTSFTWMQKHFRDNNINPDDHILIDAVVSKHDGYILFEVGVPRGYGSYVVDPTRLLLKPLKGFYRFIKRTCKRIKGEQCGPEDYWVGKKGLGFYTKKVRSVSLNTILENLNKVDLIHLDIYGEEFKVLNSAIGQLAKKVKRVHIGTHNSSVEKKLRKMFTRLGWKCIFDFHGNGRRSTPFGDIVFADGVQCWINPQIG